MRHHSSRSFRARRATESLTSKRALIISAIAIIALGVLALSRSSVAVYSRGLTPGTSERTVSSGLKQSVPAFDVRTNNSEFSKRFSGKGGPTTSERKINHRLASCVFASTLLPSITATKADFLFVDVNNDNIANPGDTIKYTVVITNSGTTDATGVMFNDTPDANTTVVPGSVTSTPVAVDDAYTATGNVRISVAAPGVLGNDADADGNTFTASAGALSTNGGNVAMNADGSFTYNPAPGFEGNDSFNYTVADTQGNTDGGTVSITVSGMIWFVDAAAAGGGDGRLTSPYNCLVGVGCYFPAAPDDPGDNIFLYSGNYTGGVTLLANQKLIGQGSSVALALVAGITLAPNSDPLPATGGANPVITTVAAATNGINLSSGNLLRGFTVGDTTATDISGSSGGALTVREVIVNGNGRALNLSGYALDADFGTIESLASTATGVTLSSVSGSLTSGSTNIQNPTGIGISIATLGAGVTGVDFGNTVVNGSTGTGVSVTQFTGNVTFGDLDITPVANQRALNATNTVAVASPGKLKSTSGSITTVNTTTAGPGAINIVGASAALRTPIDITLDSVNAVNTASAPFVINVANTTDGGFKILGSGTTAGSGGAITLGQQGAVFLAAENITLKNMNFTNANTLDGGLISCTSTTVTLCKGVINLNTTSNVSFDNLFIDRTVAGAGTDYGVFGNTVTNLTINATTIQNQGDGAGEGVMRFSNLLGTSAFTNSTFKLASAKVVDIVNSTGTLGLTVTGSTFSDTQVPSTGADGLSVRGTTTANITLDVDNSFFSKLKTVGVLAVSQGTATVNADITNSSFDPVAPGIGRGVDLQAQNTGVLNFNVNSNPKVYANGGTAISVFAVDSAAVQGRVNNNPDIKLGGAGTSGSGIVVQTNQNANAIVEINGNTISGVGFDRGIQAFSRLKTSGTGGRIDATITNNNVTVLSAGAFDIDVQAGTSASAETNEVCANIRTNTASAGGGTAFREVTGSPGSTVFLEGFLLTATNTWNINLNTPLNSVFESNAGTLTGGTCNLPANPNASLISPMKRESQFAKSAPAKSGILSDRMARLTFASAGPVNPTAADLAERARSTAAHKTVETRAASSGTSKKRQQAMHHAAMKPVVVSTMAGTVSLNIGTLPAGESMTITFEVTINSPLVPPNTTQIANQGTVSGTNFSPVLTDDPDVGGAADPTVTPVVNPNNNPDAVDDNATVAEDSGANTINVLTNDTTAPDVGETLTITAVTQGANGSVAITGGGTTVSYTPNANYCGSDSFTYTISDGNGGTDTASVSVSVTCVNDAPVANAGPDQTVNCSGGVMLDGTGTTDVDNPNSSLVFVWKRGATVIATGETATVALPVGVNTITLTVTDPGGLSSSDTVVITVVDTTGPTITLTNANITLWPPYHQYETINLTDLVASASDACDPTVDINDVVITKVTSDEAENGNGDGNTLNDIVIAADCKSVQLRAERVNSGNGRVYTITFTVVDSSGNATSVTAKVTVEKNTGTPAVDSGPNYTVLSSCQ